MSNYRLIALDMDGTLLNSQKKPTPLTLAAIRRAAERGKFVALNTGRCPPELTGFRDTLIGVDYLNCLSGALVYNWRTGEVVASTALDPGTVRQLFDLARSEDTMVHLLTERSLVQRDKMLRMEDYRMGVYQSMFEQVATPVEDLEAAYNTAPYPVSKLNIYHTDTDARERTRRRVETAELEVELSDSEITSLEVTAKGVDKGTGLKRLCAALGLTIEQAIVVGDAENDYTAMRCGALAVAMGNAKPLIAEAADVMVADNDHDGCAEAIEKYLL